MPDRLDRETEEARLSRVAEEWMDRGPVGMSFHASLIELLRTERRDALEKAAQMLDNLADVSNGPGTFRRAAAAIRREMGE